VTCTSEVTEAMRWDSSSVPTPGSGGGVTPAGGPDGVVGAGGSAVASVVGGAVASAVAVPLTVLVHPASSTDAAAAAVATAARRPRVPVTSGHPRGDGARGHRVPAGSTRRSLPVVTS
jgi:hypothetical protein